MRNAPVVGNNTTVTKRNCSSKEVEIIMLQKRGVTNAMVFPLYVAQRFTSAKCREHSKINGKRGGETGNWCLSRVDDNIQHSAPQL